MMCRMLYHRTHGVYHEHNGDDDDGDEPVINPTCNSKLSTNPGYNTDMRTSFACHL